MMNFTEFQNYVAEKLPTVLSENTTVELKEVTKNNGLILHGITVRPDGQNIAPNIYLEKFFEKYEDGEKLDNIIQQIADLAVKSFLPENNVYQDIAQKFQDFDFVKDKIIFTLVNAEQNEKLLSRVPHKNVEDLVVIYKVMLENSENGDGISTITINNDHISYWGVDTEQLHSLALENTKRLLPVTIRSMNEVMREMFAKEGKPEDFVDAMFPEEPADKTLWVISNKTMMNGASAILDTDVLDGLVEKVGGDIYILPSSIHEVIAVSTKMSKLDELKQMVQEVNTNNVEPEIRLSDNVYFYSKEDGFRVAG